MTPGRPQHLLHLAGFAAALVLCTALALAAPPGPNPITDHPIDRELLKDMRPAIQLMDISEFDDDLPKSVDYSQWVNFHRCQDCGGGCQCYAVMHILDMQKDWEHPYTPDLSWRYVLNTFQDWVEDGVHNGTIKTVNDIPPLLSYLFEQGVAPEGLCRSELDLLTGVIRPTTDALYDPNYPNTVMDFAPGPDATAIAAAQYYKAKVSEPIKPDVQELRAMLHHYGPIWACGCWWWGPCGPTVGGHAMAFVGYDDNKRQFKYVNSQGDWWGNDGGFGYIGYDDLTSYVEALRVVVNEPQEPTGRYAYSARIRITGVWRGTHTISVGVQGRPLLQVWHTHGRTKTLPFEYAGTLQLDVPLPDYAPDCWPPSAKNRWVLRVEDNDRDGATGTVREFTLARNYAAPNCHSIGHFQTQTFGGAVNVACQDPTTGTIHAAHRKTDNFFASDWFAPVATPGAVEVLVPAQVTAPVLQPRLALEYQVLLPPEDVFVGDDNKPVLHGQLLSRLGAIGQWQPVKGQTVGIYRLIKDGCVNMPAQWDLRGTRVTDAEGGFSFRAKPPQGLTQDYWAAALQVGNRYLASSDILKIGVDPHQLIQIYQKIPPHELAFPDLHGPGPIIDQHLVMPTQIRH